MSHSDIDAMIRSQQAGPTIASPFNDIQLVALLGSIITASAREDRLSPVSPPEAISAAIRLVAESIAQMQSGGLNRALDQARSRVALNDVTPPQIQ